MFTGSGQMSLRQFLILTEVAHDAVAELSELENVQLKDLNPAVNPFQFTAGLSAAHNIDELNVTLAKHEMWLMQMNNSYKTLSECMRELVEAQHVLQETDVFSEKGSGVNKLHDALSVKVDFSDKADEKEKEAGKKKVAVHQKSKVKITGRKENVEEAKKQILLQVEKIISHGMIQHAHYTDSQMSVISKLKMLWNKLLHHGDEPFDLSFPPMHGACPSLTLKVAIIHACDNQDGALSGVFEPKPEFLGEVRVPDEDIGEVDLKFDLKSDKHTTHFGLCGHATTVFPVKSKTLLALVPNLPHHNPHNPTNELVVKLYWPEEEHKSEAEILQKVYEIAKKDEEGKVKHHVPEMVWSHKFEDTSTANIRRALGLKDAEHGRHVLYIIIFRKLNQIMDLSDKEFLTAWWHIIVYHYALWGEKVHHHNVNPSNLMVYKMLDG
ncbi:uncharacterized protein BJ212DRAFT_1480212 [Suillus subaureus]|uniref:Uncharacterized protein n=1 Tax=Suillus subaureus TaxID=48587 RepID=A0A9P7EC85_9AGAM|nr:uncharacterized protein BJ212DRAFT_1480212 [Suillus subaureus]KAG1817651.1 hypothetical protein BJ212DRAFT_1480212 [Suillus subaureus]